MTEEMIMDFIKWHRPNDTKTASNLRNTSTSIMYDMLYGDEGSVRVEVDMCFYKMYIIENRNKKIECIIS